MVVEAANAPHKLGSSTLTADHSDGQPLLSVAAHVERADGGV